MSGAPGFLNSMTGGTKNMEENKPPEVDIKALEATADPVKDPPKGLAMIGNIDNANDNF